MTAESTCDAMYSRISQVSPARNADHAMMKYCSPLLPNPCMLLFLHVLFNIAPKIPLESTFFFSFALSTFKFSALKFLTWIFAVFHKASLTPFIFQNDNPDSYSLD